MSYFKVNYKKRFNNCTATCKMSKSFKQLTATTDCAMQTIPHLTTDIRTHSNLIDSEESSEACLKTIPRQVSQFSTIFESFRIVLTSFCTLKELQQMLSQRFHARIYFSIFAAVPSESFPEKKSSVLCPL